MGEYIPQGRVGAQCWHPSGYTDSAQRAGSCCGQEGLCTSTSCVPVAPIPRLVIHDLLASQLDYRNVLCIGLPLKRNLKVQLLLNMVAHTALGDSYKYTYIIPLLR